jgi:S-formylglutathione hydrolase FrmB
MIFLLKVERMKYFFTIVISMFSLALTAGTVDSILVYSRSMKKNIPCIVIKPSGYKNYKKSGKRIPVVYLLHGYSGNHRQWITEAPQLADKADAMDLLIVCPDGGYGSWYFDSPIDSNFRYETFVSKELTEYIDKMYLTISDRNYRAITGLSMGGHGGLYLGSRHKNIFGAAGSIAGGVKLRPFPRNWDISKRIGDTSCCEERWTSYSVMSVIDTLINKELEIVFDCGVDDFFIGVNRELHQKLLNKKIDHDYTERPGAHNRDYWGQSIDYQLLFFKKRFDRHSGSSKHKNVLK